MRQLAPATAAAGLRPARPIPGRNSSPTLSRNKTGTHPNRIHPNRKPAASVKRQGRNAHPAVRELAPAVHSVQTGPAGKRRCTPVLAEAPAMSRLPTVRAKQRKNPLLPVDSLAFTVRRAAALPAAHPAEAMALLGAGVAVSPRTPRGEAASPARVLPVAADFLRTLRGAAASPAKVLPVAVALAALV